MNDLPPFRKPLPHQRENSSDIPLLARQMPVPQHQCRIRPHKTKLQFRKTRVAPLPRGPGNSFCISPSPHPIRVQTRCSLQTSAPANANSPPETSRRPRDSMRSAARSVPPLSLLGRPRSRRLAFSPLSARVPQRTRATPLPCLPATCQSSFPLPSSSAPIPMEHKRAPSTLQSTSKAAISQGKSNSFNCLRQ